MDYSTRLNTMLSKIDKDIKTAEARRMIELNFISANLKISDLGSLQSKWRLVKIITMQLKDLRVRRALFLRDVQAGRISI